MAAYQWKLLPLSFIPCRDVPVGTTGGVQDRAAARVRSGPAPGHQLQDGGAVHHRHRQAVQAGPQKDLPLNFSVICRLNFIIAVDQPKFYNKFSTY